MLIEPDLKEESMGGLFDRLRKVFGGGEPAQPTVTVTVTETPAPSAARAGTAEPDAEFDDAYWFPVESVGRKVEARLSLDYEGSKGLTKRDVDVTVFYRGEGGCKFDGYCHLRKAKRTLSSKSVHRAVDRDTGEIIPDLCAYFEAKYDFNPEKPYDVMLDSYFWAMMVLRYVGSVDGALRAPERRLIAEFCQRRGQPAVLDAQKLEAIIKDYMSPSKTDFQKFVREAAAPPEVMRDIYETAKAIVATNKKPHTEHERALEYMRQKWRDAIDGAAPQPPPPSAV